MLVFNTYLLISGHIRGQGAGHFGHGGQYTAFGHAFFLRAGGPHEEDEVVVFCVFASVLASERLEGPGVVVTTIVGDGGWDIGGALTTRTHLVALSAEPAVHVEPVEPVEPVPNDSRTAAGCKDAHRVSPTNTPTTTTMKTATPHFAKKDTSGIAQFVGKSID